MRIKVVSLFLAIQVLSFTIWNTFYRADESLANNIEFSVQKVSDSHAHPHEHSELSEAAEVLLETEFEVKHSEGDDETLYLAQKRQIEKILAWLPKEHASTIDRITFNYDQDAKHRGLGGVIDGRGLIILGRLTEMDSGELSAVFIHETGHTLLKMLRTEESGELSRFVDGKNKLKVNDPIVEFYEFSWIDNQTPRSESTDQDFASFYGQTNPQEDYSEMYTLYVLNGIEARAMAENNEVIAAKYDFMKTLFNGVEFDTGKVPEDPDYRPWDMTKAEYDEELLWG